MLHGLCAFDCWGGDKNDKTQWFTFILKSNAAPEIAIP